jgi:hypothetical protein
MKKCARLCYSRVINVAPTYGDSVHICLRVSVYHECLYLVDFVLFGLRVYHDGMKSPGKSTLDF